MKSKLKRWIDFEILLLCIKVIGHIFCFGIEFFENKGTGIFGQFIVIDFIIWYSCHMYFSPISTSWYRQLSVMVNDTYLWIILYSQYCFFFLNFVL